MRLLYISTSLLEIDDGVEMSILVGSYIYYLRCRQVTSAALIGWLSSRTRL